MIKFQKKFWEPLVARNGLAVGSWQLAVGNIAFWQITTGIFGDLPPKDSQKIANFSIFEVFGRFTKKNPPNVNPRWIPPNLM